ncbi:methyl-accepting chemotaxis protein [Geomicrobium sp. JSM 1781026]|uniref:methyl-accepting chemotaxis protein n=1 Tax=Geomicrobium sp. JSM 1781026 TaxID=3344580 RepID=UPI0035C079CF
MNRETLISRNRMLSNLLIILYLLGLANNFISGVPVQGIVAYAASGAILVLIITVSAYKKWIPRTVPYLVVVFISIFSLILTATSPKLSNLLIIFISLAVVSLYNRYSLIGISGVLNLGLTNFFFISFNDSMFQGLGFDILFSLNLYIILTTIILMFQAHIASTMQQETAKEAAHAKESNAQMQKLLQSIQRTQAAISTFGQRVKSNVQSTRKVTSEIETAFNEVSAGIEQQSLSVNTMNDMMTKQDEQVQHLGGAAARSNKASQASLEETKAQRVRIGKLKTEIQQLQGRMDTTTESMERLTNMSGNIGGILETVDQIAEQTDLLSLNAAIEAARAKQHGKSFGVVADEIKKLANHSKQSTEEIRNMLTEIEEQTKRVQEEVRESTKAMQLSLAITEENEESISVLLNHAHTFSDYASELNSIVKHLTSSSLTITDELSEVAASSDESLTAMEEVVASVEEQRGHVETIESQFEELDDQNQALENLIHDRMFKNSHSG